MKNLLILAFLGISFLFIQGCTKEVPMRLPIFEKAKCEKAHKTKIPQLMIISRNVLNAVGGVSMEELQKDDNKSWLIVPTDVPDELFMDIVYLYTGKNVLRQNDCIRWERNRGDKYEVFNMDINDQIDKRSFLK